MLERFTWFRQSAFGWQDPERTIYIDPWGTPPEASAADIIFITHAHFDHFRPDEIERLSSAATAVVAPHDVAVELPGNVTPVAPGESHEIAGVRFTTVPAYNTREEALEFHPREKRWVGYILELDAQTYYHIGRHRSRARALRGPRRCDDVAGRGSLHDGHRRRGGSGSCDRPFARGTDALRVRDRVVLGRRSVRS
jgi:L-ascorbate metabolism protein UlaG (beta-lactamase superfamily)